MRSFSTESVNSRVRSLLNTNLSLQNQWEEKKERLNLTLILFKTRVQHLAELRYINTIVLYLRFETKHKTLNCRTPSPTQPRPVLAGRAVNREPWSPVLCLAPSQHPWSKSTLQEQIALSLPRGLVLSGDHLAAGTVSQKSHPPARWEYEMKGRHQPHPNCCIQPLLSSLAQFPALQQTVLEVSTAKTPSAPHPQNS